MNWLPPFDADHEALLSAVVGAMPEPFFVIDRSGRYVAVLGGATATDYHDGRRLVGKRMHDVMPTDIADGFLDKITESLDSGRVIAYDYELGSDDIDGVDDEPGLPTRLWFSGRIAPLPSHSGRPDMVVWMIFNTTELKLALHHMDEQRVELERLASTDPLTNLLNRRSFFERAASELDLVRSSNTPAALILLDIDLFKTVNDTWGHAAGDKVLAVTAEVIGRNRRTTDVVARIGGEEMALVLRSTSVERAAEIAERLRIDLGALGVGHGDTTIRITASFGVAAIRPDDDDIEEALIRADIALYAAKRGGRNRVAVQR